MEETELLGVPDYNMSRCGVSLASTCGGASPWVRSSCERFVELYSSYLVHMLFTVKIKKKREGGRHLLLFVFAHGPRAAEARWVTAAEAR
jgi:hypothetical protein